MTDNEALPYLGVYNDSLGGQDGIRRDNFFCQWLGRSGVYATTFNGDINTNSWVFIEGHTGNINGWKRWLLSHPGSKVVVGVQMLPAGGPTHAKGASGLYDAHFQTLAAKIRNAGICDRVIIRLGWEFNGQWYPWGVVPGSAEDDAAHFAANYCRISKTMREVAPIAPPAGQPQDQGKNPANLRFNWCGAKIWNSYNVENAFPADTPAGTTSTGVSYPAYPGNNYVHSVGLDIYDTDGTGNTYEVATQPWSSAILTTAWNNLVGTSTSNHNGIARWRKIAQDRGKTLSFPEWGLSSRDPASTTNPAGGFDNPFFMQKMHEFIYNPANNVEFACYYDTNAGENGGSDCRITQFPGQSPSIHPNAAERFRQLFTPPLPTRTNIGSISAITAADGLNIQGAGAGYGGTSDNFYFTSRSCGTLDMMQVKLTSASVAVGQGGLMVRQSTAAGAINAAIFVVNGNLVFQSRSALNGATTTTNVAAGITYPIWLKLVRNGTAVTAYRSADGFNWTHVAAQTLSSLSGTAAIGVAVGSGGAGILNTVGVDRLDNPSIDLGQETSITGRIVKDNADTTGVTFSSTAWGTETARPDKYGADNRFAASTAGSITATFNPGLTTGNSGLYDVYLHWPTAGSYAYDVPITVNHTGGNTPLIANQEAGTMSWVYAGTYNLNSTSNVIWGNSLTTAGDPSLTAVDAVLFVPLSPPATTTINFSDYTVTGYSGSQDVSGTYQIQDSGATLNMTGNTWKKINFAYNITPNTVLEFDFRSTAQGELHSIGLDTDNTYEAGTAGNMFTLYGTDNAQGRQNYHNYSGTNWVHYTIPIGTFYTGSRIYMFFVNDKDVSPFNSNSYFRNVSIHE